MPRQELKRRLRDLVRFETDPSYGTLGEEEQLALQAEKWVLICDLLALAPFRTSTSIGRSMQWREAARRLCDSIPPGELTEWALLQADIAHNHERGVRDVRRHPTGSCHRLLLAYAGMRRDKVRAALDVLRARRAGRLEAGQATALAAAAYLEPTQPAKPA